MKLDDRFRSLDRTPTPSYWSDAVDRSAEPDRRPEVTPPGPPRRLVALVVAAIVAVLGVGLVLKTIEPEGAVTPGGTASMTPSASPTPEDGLLPSPGYAATWLCGGGIGGCPKGGVPDALRRPLTLPSLNADGSCPVSAEHRIVQVFGPAVGDGPVYAVIPGPGPVLSFQYPPAHNSVFAGSAWGGNKVVWFAKPTYTGPILVRGAQIGGPHLVGFSGGDPNAYDSMELPPGHGWRNWPTATRVQAPGCYAYQVDGTNFSETIVFRAVEATP
jgi:hypothetical protein